MTEFTPLGYDFADVALRFNTRKNADTGSGWDQTFVLLVGADMFAAEVSAAVSKLVPAITAPIVKMVLTDDTIQRVLNDTVSTVLGIQTHQLGNFKGQGIGAFLTGATAEASWRQDGEDQWMKVDFETHLGNRDALEDLYHKILAALDVVPFRERYR